MAVFLNIINYNIPLSYGCASNAVFVIFTAKHLPKECLASSVINNGSRDTNKIHLTIQREAELINTRSTYMVLGMPYYITA